MNGRLKRQDTKAYFTGKMALAIKQRELEIRSGHNNADDVNRNIKAKNKQSHSTETTLAVLEQDPYINATKETMEYISEWLNVFDELDQQIFKLRYTGHSWVNIEQRLLISKSAGQRRLNEAKTWLVLDDSCILNR
ncbi:RinA family protein [Convivina praedatoris]|nr:RinA family protein [Convivina sp. LMG 32447]